MFTMVAQSTRTAVSTVAAFAVVSLGALAFDQGHIAAAPRGTVEIGEITAVDVTQMAALTLPEVVVTGRRVNLPEARYAAQLPEVMVIARRVVSFADRGDTRQAGRLNAANVGAEGALLK